MDAEGFVGRAGELAELEGLVAGVASGVGGALLVTGEQGIGKSALLREGLAGAEAAGCRVGWRAANEMGRQFPLRLMAECLGEEGRFAAEGSAGPVAGGQSQQDQRDAARLPGLALAVDPVLAGVERLLALVDRLCERSPVVLAMEDLQWADEASLLVWRRLSRVVGQLPLLVIGSCRPVPVREDLERLQRGVAAHGGVALRLGPLPQGEAAQLAGELLGARPGHRLAEAVGRAGGNPLYVRELVDALARDGRVAVAGGVAELAGEPDEVGVPESLAAAISARLGALPAEAAGVLRWAAVLGSEFSVTDLGMVTRRPAGELLGMVEQAMTAGVVAGAGPRLGFRHELIRQVLYEGIPQAAREALHLEAAQLLAEAGAPPERVAVQLLTAQQVAGEQVTGKLAEGWVREWLAGAMPRLVYQTPQIAAELLRAALDPAAEGPGWEELEAGLVTAAFLLQRDDEVLRAGGRILARGSDPELAAEVAWLVGYTLNRTRRAAEAVAAVEEALARPGTSKAQAARLQALHAVILARAGEAGRAAEVGAEALAGAERTGDRFAAGYALHALSGADFLRRDHDSALAHLDRALDVMGEDPQTTDLRLLLLGNKAVALGELDRQAEGISITRQALVLAERAGTPRQGAMRLALAFQYFQAGRWDDALTELEPATVSDELGPLLSGLIALIAVHRDSRDTAAEQLGAVADAPLSDRQWALAPPLLLARALAAEQDGRPAEAAAVLARSLDPGTGERMPVRYALLPVLARLALAAGDTGAAAAAAAAAAGEAADKPLPVKSAAADHCRGLVEQDPGPVLAAAGYYESAGRPLERALALEDAAVLLAGRGDLAGGRRAHRGAAGLYLELGAAWDLRRADARMLRYGIRRSRGGRRARPARGWQALTPTETKVAYLVADGRSNPEIATELFLSRNTVQTHVSHILAKLGGRSRGEIIRQALEHPAAS